MRQKNNEALPQTIERAIVYLILIITVLLTNRGIWLCLTNLNDPGSFCTYNYPGEELILYFLVSGLTIWLLKQSQMGKIFINKWKGNWPVLVFLALAAFSILWSVHRASTFYHLLILIFSTLLAAFLGTYFSSERWLELMAGIGGIIVIASGLLSIFFPDAVIMEAPHEGSWRGIYWHKNFTGSLMAFWNAIFLLYGLNVFHTAKLRAVFSAFLYLLSLVFVFLSFSAAGIAIWLGLNLTIIILLLWSRVKHILKKQHYILLGCFVVAFLILGMANLDLAFRLLNRESSLTGRTPLWTYLIEKAVLEKPLHGHGLSAIWDAPGFKRQTTLDLRWGFTITNGHNGFLDILLGLGVVGLMLTVLLLILGFYRTARLFVTDSRAENLLPFLIALYFFLSNLSISFFLGIESFHWVLLMMSMFIATPIANHGTR